jgi:hypothetical protein
MVSAAESDVWIVGIGGGIPGAGEIETPAAVNVPPANEMRPTPSTGRPRRFFL